MADIERPRVASLENSTSLLPQSTLLGARKWASLRLQTLYRTLEGMMKNRSALELLLRAELPALSDDELNELVDSKFCCLAAMQQYQVFSRDELLDVEVRFARS